MRPRAIQGVPGLNSDASPFERFQQFARMIVSVPKAEADKESMKAADGKNGNGTSIQLKDEHVDEHKDGQNGSSKIGKGRHEKGKQGRQH